MMVSTPVHSTGNLIPEQCDGEGHGDDRNQAQSTSSDVMDTDNPECMLASIKQIDMKSHAAQFILKTRDGGHLTQMLIALFKMLR